MNVQPSVGNIKLRTKPVQFTRTEHGKKHIVVLRRDHVELVARFNTVTFQPLVQSLEMLTGELMLLYVLNRRLLISFDLHNENLVALFDEKIGAEVAPFGMSPFFQAYSMK